MRKVQFRSAALVLALACVACSSGTDESHSPGSPAPSHTTVTLSTVTLAPQGWPDPDGYRVVFDSTSVPIGTQAVMSQRPIQPGIHDFELSGIAPNCQVTNGPNPREVTAVAGTTLNVIFQVECHPPTGAVNVAIDFRSPGTLSDSLVAQLDGGPGITFAGTDTARFAPVQAGFYAVVVRGTKTACHPAGLFLSQRISVGDQPVNVAFPLSCSVPGSGTIKVNMQTTVINWGNSLPSFRVALDDTLSLSIPGNGSVTFSNVSSGAHVLQVSAPPFCGASFYEVNRKVVQVQPGFTVTVNFHELCIG